MGSVIRKLVLAGCVVHLWFERNARHFRAVRRPWHDVIYYIKKEIKFKILGMNVQDNMVNMEVCKDWGINGVDRRNKGNENNGNQ